MIKLKFDLLVKNKSTGYFHHQKYQLCELMLGVNKLFNYENCDLVEARQFTGITDKNDKEIYKGDIVREVFNSDGRGLSVVELDVANPCFCLVKLPKSKYKHISPEYDFVGGGIRSLEIIGNIYENPELRD